MKYYYRFIFIFAFISPFQSNLIQEESRQFKEQWATINKFEKAPEHSISLIDDLLEQMNKATQSKKQLSYTLALDPFKDQVMQKRHQTQLAIFNTQLADLELKQYEINEWDTYVKEAEELHLAITNYGIAYPSLQSQIPFLDAQKASHQQMAKMRFDIIQYGVDKIENNEITDFLKCIEYTELIQKHAYYFLEVFPNHKNNYLADNYIKFAINKGNQLLSEEKKFNVIAKNFSSSLDSIDLDAHYTEITAYMNEHPNSIKASALGERKEAIDFHKFKKSIQSLPKSIKILNQQIALAKKYQSSFKNEDFIAELKEIEPQIEAKRKQVYKKELAHYTQLAKKQILEKANSFAQSKNKCPQSIPPINMTKEEMNKSDKNTQILHINYIAKIKMGDNCKAINQLPITGNAIIKGNAYKGLKIDYTNVQKAGNKKEVALN